MLDTLGFNIGASNIIAILILIFAVILIFKGVKVVPQSESYIVERFGKVTKAFPAG